MNDLDENHEDYDSFNIDSIDSLKDYKVCTLRVSTWWGDNIIKEVAHNFGFKSTTQKTSSKIKTVIDIMLKESILEVYKGNIKLKS